MKTLTTILITMLLSGCATFEYSNGTETLKGKTLFKAFKDVHAERDGFEISIGSSEPTADPLADALKVLQIMKAMEPG